MEKKEVEEDHDPQEVLDAVNELIDLVEPIRKQLAVLVAIPDMREKLDKREAELKQNSEKLAQEALTLNNAGNQKDTELTLKKKKILDDEILKAKKQREALISKQQNVSKDLLSKVLHDGIKRAIDDIKLGKAGKYKQISIKEIEKQMKKDPLKINKQEEEELLAELDQLDG